MTTGRHETDPLARMALDEIRGGAPIADSWVLETLADTLAAKAGRACAWALARAAGCEVREDPNMPAGAEALMLPGGVIVVRLRRDRRRMAVAVLHELAHWLLLRAGLLHTHADVWCLTLALAAPVTVLRALRADGALTFEELHRVAAVSPWAVLARLEMATAA